MDSHNILPLLGLALQGGNLAVGEEPVEAAARARDARILLLASDAADNTRRRVEHFAQAGQCLWTRLPFTKAELGRALGRTSAAVAAVTDLGLAGALGRRLAALDPETYGELSQRLEIKAQRARQRRAEQEEKNPRTGKRRPKASPEDRKAPPERVRNREALPKKDRDWNREARPGVRKAPPEKVWNREALPEDRRSPGGGGSLRRRSRSAPGAGQPAARRRSGGGGPPGRTKGGPYAHSRPVKKGKGSFRKREDGSK